MREMTLAKSTFKSYLDKGQIVPESKVSSFFSEDHKLEKKLFSKWFQMITTFSFLESPDSETEEIFLFAPSSIIYKKRSGKEEFISDVTSEDLQIAYDCLAIKNGIDWNYSNPFVSFKAIIHSRVARVSLSHFSMSSNETSTCFIRFPSSETFPLESFGENQKPIIENLIKERKNILIAGSTGSGKTSYLNSALNITTKEEHLIFLEDTAELIAPHKHVTSLIANKFSKDNNLKTYMSHVLRMSPDRIVLGEMRSSEVEPFLLAMNTGHKGLLSTIHANSAVDTLHRIALLFKVYSGKDLSFELVLKLATTNIDAVVFLEDKKVVEIIQVFGSEGNNVFYDKIYERS